MFGNRLAVAIRPTRRARLDMLDAEMLRQSCDGYFTRLALILAPARTVAVDRRKVNGHTMYRHFQDTQPTR